MDSPAVVKGALKFKKVATTNQKKTTVELPPKIKEEKAQEKQAVNQKQINQQEQQEDYRGKTAAEKAFEIAKKTRIIHKKSQRTLLSNKERIQKRNKVLSKLPDHEDLFKTGEKIQKGY